jgi:outer membrane protein OmpA-like peptidoglycan-associated protein
MAFAVSAQEYRTDTLRVFFPNDRMELSPQALHVLDSLLPMILRNKKAPLSIEGYADYTGTPERNIYLSDGRARVVKEYLISKGIDSLRLRNSRGHGAIEPPMKPVTTKGVPQHRKAELIVQWPVGKQKPKVPVSEQKKEITIENLKKGGKIVLPNVNFEGGRHTLLASAYPTIKQLSEILKQHSGIRFEIQGHICCTQGKQDGYDADDNTQTLSLNRAKVVYDMLIGYGIDSTRMTYKGYGGAVRLIKEERTEADRMMNRRVEIKVLSN